MQPIPPAPSSSASRPSEGPTWGRRATVLGAGTAFAVAAALPAALAPGGPSVAALGLLAPLLLAGLLVWPPGGSRHGLLLVFPGFVVLALAGSGAPSPSPLAVAMIAGTWLTYVVLAVRLLRPAPAWDCAHHPIVDGLPQEPPRRRVTRAAYWAVLLVGATALAIVAPLLGTEATYRSAWGEAARAARLLVAVVGGAVAVGSVAAIVAPGLRQRGPEAAQTVVATRRRALLYLLAAAAFAALAWAIRSHA